MDSQGLNAMDLYPITPPFGKIPEEKIIEKLYERFCNDLIDSQPMWHNKPLKMRWHVPINGRHAIFHHIITDSNIGQFSSEANRPLSPDRCARLHWIAPLIRSTNSCFPESENNDIRWWESIRRNNSGKRYSITTANYDYLIVIDERADYALLVTAFYVEHNHRRNKLRKEHDNFWRHHRIKLRR